MKPPKREQRTVRLRECPCQDGGLIADPNDSILRRVKILGYESVNRRRYTPQAVRQDIRLYEGIMENITVNEDGMFGDLRFNPEHADARSVRWFAENMPDALGLSHNATGQGHD